MNDLEDLLTRTLHDPAYDVPPPVHPLAGIRARARSQRRHAGLAVAGVAAAVAAAVLVPTAAVRLVGPANNPPAQVVPAGLLDWAPRGPLATDAALVRDATASWDLAARGGLSGPVRVIWAGPVGSARVVLLQARVADGTPTLAQVTDDAGPWTGLRTEPIDDPGIAAIRLVTPGPDLDLVLRPGAYSVSFVGSTSHDLTAIDPSSLGGDGRLSVPDTFTGRHVVVMDRAGRVLGDGTVPPANHQIVPRGVVRWVAPTRIWSEGQAPSGAEYGRARILADRLGGGGPVDVSVLQGGGSGPADHELTLSFYELHRAGRVRLAAAVWDGDTPTCVQVSDVTDRPGRVYALASRCPDPDRQSGSLTWESDPSARVTSIRIDAARPGERPYADVPENSNARGATTTGFGPEFPTGPGELTLVDQQGHALPPAQMFPYPS